MRLLLRSKQRRTSVLPDDPSGDQRPASDGGIETGWRILLMRRTAADGKIENNLPKVAYEITLDLVRSS